MHVQVTAHIPDICYHVPALATVTCGIMPSRIALHGILCRPPRKKITHTHTSLCSIPSPPIPPLPTPQPPIPSQPTCPTLISHHPIVSQPTRLIQTSPVPPKAHPMLRTDTKPAFGGVWTSSVAAAHALSSPHERSAHAPYLARCVDSARRAVA